MKPSRKVTVLALRIIGSLTLTAFVACFLPSHWIDQCTQLLGFEPFPNHPVAYYLARHLSMFYGFAGALFLVVAADLERYKPLLAIAGYAAIAMGLLQATLDVLCGLPIWWTLIESSSTCFGGILLLWLERYQDVQQDL